MKTPNKDNLWVLGGNVFNAGLGFLTFMALARVLSVAAFGEWLLYVAGFTFMEMVRAGFIHQALVKYLATARFEPLRKVILGSSWWIGIGSTAVFSLLLASIGWVFESQIAAIKMTLFFKWYPIVMWLTLPLNMGLWVSHARQQYPKMVILQLVITGGFALFVFAGFVFSNGSKSISVFTLLIVHSIVRFLASLYALLSGWSAVQFITNIRKRYLLKLVHFGKYSLFSLLGTNMLKSTDIFLIGAFLGPAAVALYQLPLKIIELAEIPLRSFATTAFPKIAQWLTAHKYEHTTRFIQNQITRFLLWMIPVWLLMQIGAGTWMKWIGGASYLSSGPIFQILLVYVLLLPADRFIGIALDSLGKPQWNTIKITLMVIINIIGDCWVLNQGGSLMLVAGVTLVNIAIGIAFGAWKMRRWLPIFSLHSRRSTVHSLKSIVHRFCIDILHFLPFIFSFSLSLLRSIFHFSFFTFHLKNRGLSTVNRRLIFLDFAKGFAILTIVLMHYGQQMQLTGWLSYLVKLGGTGIHVFFLLSGFGLMLGHYQGWQHFFKRRMSKILLPYYFFLTIMYVGHLLFSSQPISGYAFLGNLLFVQLFDESIVYSFGIQFWFISTILQFYLVFPALRAWLKKSNITVFMFACIVLSITYASVIYLTGAYQSKLWSRLFLQYLWEFALGMALAKMYQTHQFKFWQVPLKAIVVGLILGFGFMAILTFKLKTFGIIFNDYPALLGYLSLTIALFKLTQHLSNTLNNAMLWIGKYSYSLYLVHIAVLSFFLQYYLNDNPFIINFLKLPLYLSLAFIFTYIFHTIYQLIFGRESLIKILKTL